MNSAADRWAMAQAEAADLARELVEGDYFVRWEDDDEPDEQVTAELRKALAVRALTLTSDDMGLRVVRVEGESTR